jgi:nucleoside-diphosphate-sugar epimerase
MVALARKHVATVIGRGDRYFSSIHADDAAAAVVAALTVPAGVYNVGDDEPLTRREWGDALCAAFGVRPWVHAPGRLAAPGGEMSEPVNRSQRVSNRRLREASAWRPRYPSVREGFRELAARLREEGPVGA